MIAYLAMFSLALLGQATDASADSIAAPVIAKDDSVLTTRIRAFTNLTLVAGAPGGGTDMVIIFGIDADQKMVISSFAAVASKNATMPPPDDAVAIVRVRTKNAEKEARPDKEDMMFATSQHIPVFVAGAWKRPAVMWQIDAHANPPSFRTINIEGVPGPWQPLAR